MKNKLGIFYIIIGILSILYFIGCLHSFGLSVNFYSFFAFIGLIFIGIGIFRLRVNDNEISAWLLRFIKVFRVLEILVLISFIVIESALVCNSFSKYNEKADFVVVLGAAVKGKTMSLALYQRMEESLKYLKKYTNAKVVVSGGKGPGEDIAEAEAMKEFLLKHGISEDRIIVENKSRNTMENMKNTKAILQKLYGKSNFEIVLVTNNFHMFRAKMLGERCGFKVHSISAPIHYGIILNSYVREYFGVIKSFIFDR